MATNKMTSQDWQLARLAQDLVDTPPKEWLDFLFDLQTEMIGAGLFEASTQHASAKHAEFCGALKYFFTQADLIINADK